jgi:hypothetical protein
MEESGRSPRITDFSWGSLEVEGGLHYKDAKLFPGGSKEWDWRETGTDHEAGIQPGDLTELLDAGAEAVVLSQGVYGRLQVSQEAMELLRNRGVAIHSKKTEEAIALYNELRGSVKVAGLFHTTC